MSKKEAIFEPLMRNKSIILLMEIKMGSFTAKSSQFPHIKSLF